MKINENHIELLYKQSSEFLIELTKDCGEPINKNADLDRKKLIQQFTYPNQFYLEVDLSINEIVWTHNMNVFLKDGKENFTLLDFYKLVPVQHLKCFGLFANEVYKMLKIDSNRFNFTNEFINMKIPIFCPKLEKIIVVQQTGIASKYDANNNLIAHLNHYIIINEEYKQPFEYLPTFPGRKDFDAELYKMVKPHFFNFTKNQVKLLSYYANWQKSSIAQAEEKLNFTKNNVMFMNKRILEIAEQEGIGKFETAKQVAGYFRKLNWV